jgi:hypothetical protein
VREIRHRFRQFGGKPSPNSFAPGNAWNDWRPGGPHHERIVSTHAVCADLSNRLWIVVAMRRRASCLAADETGVTGGHFGAIAGYFVDGEAAEIIECRSFSGR